VNIHHGNMSLIGNLLGLGVVGCDIKLSPSHDRHVNIDGLGYIRDHLKGSTSDSCHKFEKCKNDDMSLGNKDLAPLSLSAKAVYIRGFGKVTAGVKKSTIFRGTIRKTYSAVSKALPNAL
jgi:hypothetical protein